jgi:glycosyltransferase involved in cell wall biosynthesis
VLRRSDSSIVHVVHPGEAGGLETVVHALARGLAESGNRVHVVSVSDDPPASRFLERFSGSCVRTETLSAGGRNYAREREAFTKLVTRLRPSVVHTHGLRPDVVDASAARAIGVPTMTTVHGYTDASLRAWLYGYVQRRQLHAFDAVVAVSGPLSRRLVPYVTPARLHVIQNAFAQAGQLYERNDARARLGISDERFLIGWIGRLSPEKGLDVMLEALARLADNVGAPMALAVIGDGGERQRMERRARALGVANLVRWHGTQAAAGTLMKGFDVFVLSSDREGTPMVLLEAMFARAPIVSTRVGGVPDMLTTDEALLVPRRSSRALADAIRDVMNNPSDARRRARRAAERLAAHHGMERWLSRYEELYQHLKRPFWRD